MYTSLKINFLLFFLIAGSLFCSCQIQSHSTKFYILNPIDFDKPLVSKTSRNSNLSVEIGDIRLPRYLERPQIIYRSSKYRLEMSEFHQWGGNLRNNMIQVLAKNLSLLLSTSDIAISPYHRSIPSDIRIEIELMEFERNNDGCIMLSAQWRILQGKDRTPLAVKITDLKSSPVPEQKDFENTVLTMSKIFGELSQIIAKEILHTIERDAGK